MPLWQLSVARQPFVSAVASLMIAKVSLASALKFMLTDNLFQNERIPLKQMSVTAKQGFQLSNQSSVKTFPWFVCLIYMPIEKTAVSNLILQSTPFVASRGH